MCLKQIGSCLKQQTATGIRICITPARTLEAKVWLLLLEPKARQGHVGWCLLLLDCLAAAKSILTALSLHLAPYAAPLLQQEAEPETSVKPGVLLGTASYVP